MSLQKPNSIPPLPFRENITTNATQNAASFMGLEIAQVPAALDRNRSSSSFEQSKATARFFSQSNKKAASTRLHLAPNGIIDTDSYGSQPLIRRESDPEENTTKLVTASSVLKKEDQEKISQVFLATGGPISLAGGGPTNPKTPKSRITVVTSPPQKTSQFSPKETLLRTIAKLAQEASFLSEQMEIIIKNIDEKNALTDAIEDQLKNIEENSTRYDAVELTPKRNEFTNELTEILSESYREKQLRSEKKEPLERQHHFVTFLISLLQAKSKEEAITILQEEKKEELKKKSIETGASLLEIPTFDHPITINSANITILIWHFRNKKLDLNQCQNGLLSHILKRCEEALKEAPLVVSSLKKEAEAETNKFQAKTEAVQNYATYMLEILKKAEQPKTVTEKSLKAFSPIFSFFK